MSESRSTVLIESFCSGDATESDMQEILKLLESDSAFRGELVDELYVHGLLTSQRDHESAEATVEDCVRRAVSSGAPNQLCDTIRDLILEGQPAPPPRRPVIRMIAAVVAVAAVIVLVLQPFGSGEGHSVPAAGAACASVLSTDGAQWQMEDAVAPGDDLMPRIYHLLSGEAAIRLNSGTTVRVAGETAFELHRDGAMSLSLGKAAIAVADGAHIKVRVPGALITDLGTSFSVQVDAMQTTDVFVFDGEVQITPTQDKQSPATVSAGSGVSFDAKRQAFHSQALAAASFLHPAAGSGLELVSQSDVPPPERTLEWRFDAAGPADRTTTAHPRIDWEHVQHRLEDGNGYIHFPGNVPTDAYLVTGQLNARDFAAFSIELRFRLPTLDSAKEAVNWKENKVLLAINSGEAEADVPYKQDQLAAIELFFPHAENAVVFREEYYLRAFVRKPPGVGGSKTMISATSLAAGQWHHVILSHDGQTSFLYMNGILASAAQDDSLEEWSPDREKLHLVLGHRISGPAKTRTQMQRVFSGDIDDVIVRPRALTADEVKARYESARTKPLADDNK